MSHGSEPVLSRLRRAVREARPYWSSSWMAIVLFLVAELWFFGPSLRLGLVADDFVFRDVAQRPMGALWTAPADLHGHYRPLSYSLKYLLFKWFGEEAPGWHVVNFVLHLATVLLLFWALRSLSRMLGSKGNLPAILGTILLQLHPASLQNVYWSSGFSELLAVAFGVTALLFAVRFLAGGSKSTLVLSLLSFLCAVLSKESAVVLAPVLAVIGWMASERGDAADLRAELRTRWRTLVWSWLAISGGGVVLIITLGFTQISAGIASRSPIQLVWVVMKGSAMVLVPDDAWSLFTSLTTGDLWWLVLVSGAVLVMLIASYQHGSLTWKWVVSLVASIMLLMMPYGVGGYVAQRLVYAGVVALSVHMAVLAIHGQSARWGKWETLFLVGFVLYLGLAAFSSFRVQRDWEKADREAKKVRSAFVDTYRENPRRDYLVLALPNRLRQAWIVGAPSTDFAGALRSVGVRARPSMECVARIVFTGGSPGVDRISVNRVGRDTLYVSARDQNMFFLFGDVATSLDQRLGARYRGEGYDIEVQRVGRGSRAAALRVILDGQRPREVVALSVSGEGYRFEPLSSMFVSRPRR